VPPSDAERRRVRTLLAAAYDLSLGTVHSIQDVTVRAIEVERPVFPPERTRGTWTGTVPTYTRTDVAEERVDLREPVWLDLVAEVDMTLVLEFDAGEVERIVTREIAGFQTLDEFKQRFQILDFNLLDLDRLLKELDVSTVDDLREQYHHLVTEIHLKTPPAFNPDDPANRRHYTLNLAILIRDGLDLVRAVREAKLARAALERTLTYHDQVAEAEVRTPYAPLLIFPKSALADLAFGESDVQRLVSAEGISAVFIE
jgi:hypothetical protein